MQDLMNRYEDPATSTVTQPLEVHVPHHNLDITNSPPLNPDSKTVDQLNISPVKSSTAHSPDQQLQSRPQELGVVTTLITEMATAGVPEIVHVGGETVNNLKAEKHQENVGELMLEEKNKELVMSRKLVEEQAKTISELELKIRELEFRNVSLRAEVDCHQVHVDQLMQDQVGIMENITQQTKIASELKGQLKQLEVSR